ncbi:MAG: hypothetical protein ABI413_04650 [Ktedonobacteraceae bacterium]
MPARSHIVPIHISTPERVLSIGPLSLTAKQFLLLLLGSSLSYRLWQSLSGLASGPGLVLCFCLALIPVLGAGACAFLHLAGRSLDQWVLVLLRFCLHPRLALWRSLRHFPDQLYPQRSEENEQQTRVRRHWHRASQHQKG